jgi:hypothetical protein
MRIMTGLKHVAVKRESPDSQLKIGIPSKRLSVKHR